MGLMLFQSTGLYLMHQVQVSYVRHEMKQRIKAGVPEDELVVLKISKSEELDEDIFEREHSREFRYKGQMYDVIRLVEQGDTTVYTCIHDVKESGLFEALDRMVNEELNEDDDEKRQREMMLGFFQKVYLPVATVEMNLHGSTLSSNFAYSDIVSEEHIIKAAEPPQFMFLA